MPVYIHVSAGRDDSTVKINVAGSLDGDGAKLLKKTCLDLLKKNKDVYLEIDLEQVSFLGEDAAHLLRGLKKEPNIQIMKPGFLTLEMLKDLEGN